MTWSTLPDRTKRLRPRSAKKQREHDDSRPVVAAVFDRDGHNCVLRRCGDIAGQCYGPLTPHHIVKQSRKKGLWVPENLVTLCSHHNGTWVEGNRRAAERLGLVAREVHELEQAWRDMRRHGLTPGPLTIPCTGPDHTALHRREIHAGEAACEACGHFQPIIANPDGGGGGILAPHEVVW